MGNYYLAVDIGASSGRHMLASMEDGKMKLEEVYRFPNGMDNKKRYFMLGCRSSFYRNQERIEEM